MRVIGVEVREEFLQLVCSGMSLRAAAAVVGVSWGSGVNWWRASGLMELVLQPGRVGGVSGSAPPSGVGRTSGGGRARRPLSSEDRAVIAAGVRAGWSLARIGAEIGRDKSVVCREIARNRSQDGRYWG